MTTNGKQRVTVFIHAAIVKHAKTQAIIEELTLTDLVEKALINYFPKETIVRKHKIKNEVKNGKT